MSAENHNNQEVPKLLGYVFGMNFKDAARPTTFQFIVEQDKQVYVDQPVVVRTAEDENGFQKVAFYGIINEVCSYTEGLDFTSDIIELQSNERAGRIIFVASVAVTRLEPEFYTCPMPGDGVYSTSEEDMKYLTNADKMELTFPAGIMLDKKNILPINYEFVNGVKGGHINISGISGVATKTSYALFLINSILNSKGLQSKHNSKKPHVLIFNVKGEDLFFIDKENKKIKEEDKETYKQLGLEAQAFASVEFFAPCKKSENNEIDINSSSIVTNNSNKVKTYFFTINQFCKEELLRFAFSGSDEDSNIYYIFENICHNLSKLALKQSKFNLSKSYEVNKNIDLIIEKNSIEGKNFDIFCEDSRQENTLKSIGSDYYIIDNFDDLIILIEANIESWVREQQKNSISAFKRRIFAQKKDLASLVLGTKIAGSNISNVEDAKKYSIDLTAKLTVVDINKLSYHAQSFVVGSLLAKLFRQQEEKSEGVVYIVLDELNKYAPSKGKSSIKQVLLDIAERGRSLGIILIGAQQTASEVETRIISNSAIRVVGRLDSSEASKSEYTFLGNYKSRAAILQPGTMIVSQPETPYPILIRYPFPAWATRRDEVNIAEKSDESFVRTKPDLGLN